MPPSPFAGSPAPEWVASASLVEDVPSIADEDWTPNLLLPLPASVSVQDFVDAPFPPSEEAFAQSSATTAPRFIGVITFGPTKRLSRATYQSIDHTAWTRTASAHVLGLERSVV